MFLFTRSSKSTISYEARSRYRLKGLCSFSFIMDTNKKTSDFICPGKEKGGHKALFIKTFYDTNPYFFCKTTNLDRLFTFKTNNNKSNNVIISYKSLTLY